jgi:hypothetical protein
VAGGLAALCLSRRDHSAKLALLHRERSPPPPHGARVEEVGA